MHLAPSNNPSTGHTSTRRVFVNGLLLVIGVFVWMVVGAKPAFADEFVVGILLGQTTNDTADFTFMDGFQLAVDQSPDVSHPAGVEGGDHLGSMDVIMMVIEDVTEPDRAVAAVAELIERDRAPIIVADVSPEVLATIFGPVTESETMLIALSGTSEAEFPATLFFFDAPAQGRTEVLLTDRAPTFQAAFLAEYGGPPSDAATRGYIAGRLVDLSVEATDRDPYDEQALVDGLLDAIGAPSVPPEDNGSQTSTTPATDPATLAETPVDTTSANPLATSPFEPGSSSFFNRGLVAVILVALVIITWVAFRRRKQRLRSG